MTTPHDSQRDDQPRPSRRLVIDYVLESRRPGYAFTTPTGDLPEAVVRDIWRSAMPRGQGWSAYVGARALKGFPLEDGRQAALCAIEVTDRADESGRRGIRRAEIEIVDGADYRAALQARLDSLPEPVRAAADERLSCPRWLQLVERAIPRLRKEKSQVILASPYTTPESWLLVTALMIRVALAFPVRAVRGFPSALPLTSLALDYRDESPLVALPLERARALNGARVIEIE